MKKNSIKLIVALCIVTILLSSCLPARQRSFNRALEKTTIKLDLNYNLNEYSLIFLSDTHINNFNDEISGDFAKKVQERVENFKLKDIPSNEQFGYYIDKINDLHPDTLILGADIIDTNSDANIQTLKSGLSKLQIPYLYLRSDHDNEAYWLKTDNFDHRMNNQKSIDMNYNVNMFYQEYADFVILVWNNSHHVLSPQGLLVAKEVIAKNKPIILATHVPLASYVDSTLDEKCKEILNGNLWLWGKDYFYKPDSVTQEFLDLVHDQKNNFKLVLGGHLHFGWDGEIAPGVRQVISAQGYTGNYLHIQIS